MIKWICIISLLIVKAMIFVSIVFRQLSTFLPTNSLINTSVQKVGISGILGCQGEVTQLIRKAGKHKRNLPVLLLDLANAYSFIAYKLIQLTMLKHHFPFKTRNLIAVCYKGKRWITYNPYLYQHHIILRRRRDCRRRKRCRLYLSHTVCNLGGTVA